MADEQCDLCGRPEPVMRDHEDVLMQLLIWGLTITVLLELGQLTVGLFFGIGSTLTWNLTLGTIFVAFLPLLDSDEDFDDVAAVILEPT